MPAPYNGQCLCGAVSLSVSSDPAAVLACFCRHCSVGSGGTHQIMAQFPHDSVKIESGEDRITKHIFKDTASGRPKEKAFCAGCGVTFWTVPESIKGKFILIRPAVFGAYGEEFKPTSEINVKDRPTWARATEGAEQSQT